MNYLVTGGAGYLGSHLVREMIGQGHNVTIFDDHSTSIEEFSHDLVTNVNGSITSKGDLESLFSSNTFHGICHIAAKKSASESLTNRDLYWDVNVNATQNLLEYCALFQIKNFVFASSAAVYGSTESPEKINEIFETRPESIYGETKLESEKLISEWSKKFKSKAAVFRLFNLAGCNELGLYDRKGENLVPLLLRTLKSGNTFNIYGSDLGTPDGTPVRDYIHVQDAARAHLAGMDFLQSVDESYYEIFNICSGIGTSVKDVVLKVENFLDRENSFVLQDKRAGDPGISIGDYTKFQKLTGWEPLKSVDEMISSSIFAHFQ
jgi:UDP-glucose 4-epimerase